MDYRRSNFGHLKKIQNDEKQSKRYSFYSFRVARYYAVNSFLLER